MILRNIIAMKRLKLIFPLILICIIHLTGQKVGIGTTEPVTNLNLIGAGSIPTIPGTLSTGIFRIGLYPNEGIDFGKMAEPPFAGWIQAGYDGYLPDPLSLNPLGGYVGIGTSNPVTKLHVNVGDSFFEGFIIQGVSSPYGLVPNLGDGSRMMYFPARAAFRAGVIDGGAYWDDVNVGRHSVAMGYNTTANGTGSVALGEWAHAYGVASIAMGNGPLAGGHASTAFGIYTNAVGTASFASGQNTEARGNWATAMGHSTIANGRYSTALGFATNSKGFSSTVVGMFNDSILTMNETVVSPTTPLFIVGNGNSNAPGERKNAMVVRKDGRVGIGTSLPSTKLDVIGAFNAPSIPNITSTGILRIGVASNEGIDIGKMGSPSYAGWIQSGLNGTIADPLVLQPSGGNVGIGTTTPTNKLSVVGNTNITGNADIAGYTHLGNSSPNIKMKKLTGTSAATENAWVYIPHGLNVSKIISVNILLGEYGRFPPNWTFNPEFEYTFALSTNDIIVYNSPTNSQLIISLPLTILIVYEE